MPRPAYSAVAGNIWEFIKTVLSGKYEDGSDFTLPTDNASLDTNLGAKADSAASTDTGTFSLIALVKRGLQSLTTVIARLTGAANVAQNQVALSTSAATIVAARATRRSVVIRNMDASINVYVGIATVTAGNGFLLKPGESISIDAVVLIQGIAASGTPSVCYAEVFD